MSNLKKVTQAMFAADYAAGELPGDADQRPGDFHEQYARRATAAIGALTNQNALAAVLHAATGEWADPLVMDDALDLAAAAIAWMKDRPGP